MIDNEKVAIIKAVDEAIGKIREHVDSVHIFITKQQDDGTNNTVSYNNGSGNWLARKGQIRDWVTAQDAMIRAEAEADIDEED